MSEKKYKIQQVSGNISQHRGYSEDLAASLFLEGAGFMGRSKSASWENLTYIGAIPMPRKKFFVYYDEPKNRKEEFGGTFRLVRKDGVWEQLIDRGSATESHMHRGLGTLTFYGRGSKLASWSFHCKPKEVRR